MLALWTLRLLALIGLLTLALQPRGLAAGGLLLGFWALGEILHRAVRILEQIAASNQEMKALLLVDATEVEKENQDGNPGTPQLSQRA